MTEPVRLSRRLADLLACSRREAELYISGGWVRVDGEVVETPNIKVQDQKIELDPKARLEPVLPVTLLLHKPPGYDWLDGPRPARELLLPAGHWSGDRSPNRIVKRHLCEQVGVTPLETGASGLLVFTQDWRIRRKLQEDAARVEHEVIVDVTGDVTEAALRQLNRAPVIDGRAMVPAKVSVSRQVDALTGLRFAVKGSLPGQIAQMCAAAGLTVKGMKRIRIGRITLSALPLGQWRYLLPYERF